MQQKSLIYLFLFIGGIFLFSSCSKDDEGTIIFPMEFGTLEYQEDYEVMLADTLKITPEILNLPQTAQFSWELNQEEIATTHALNYELKEAGTFSLEFSAVTANDSLVRTYQITVIDPYELYFRPKTASSSQFISKVFDYKPAPGQFINSMFTQEDAQNIIGGKSEMISLGAWGGYVIFGFDHTIENNPDQKDFVVYGNSFSGGSEPGIVQVSFDENGNGLPDDTWYEIAGSAHIEPETLLTYELTYTNPGEYVNVPWVDNRGAKDSVLVNQYHTQNYYPNFIEEQDEVTFTGTRVFTKINTEPYITIDPLEWGYVDNYDANYRTYKGNAMEIDWAVDKDYNSVQLRGIDFVKVYTAVQANAGILGEISTEIKGASDLSMIE